MLKELEKKLRPVRVRCSVNLVLRYLGRVLTAAGLAAALAVLVERLLSLTVINNWSVWALFAIAASAVLVLALMSLPNRMQVSLLVDDRLRLRERFSTVLALGEMKDPFAMAARDEVRRTVREIAPGDHFPIRPTRCWLYAGGTWLITLTLVLFMPQKDLLGFFRSARDKQELQKQIQEAKVDIKEASDSVKLAVKQLGDPNLNDALSKLDEMPKGAKPDEIKRQAIRKMGDLSEKLKNMQNGVQLNSVNLMRQMLKQLRGSSDPLLQQMRLALAQGNFAGASNLMRQLQQQLADGKLSEQQRKDIAERLQKLAGQLKALAEKNSELEKELEKRGLDKSLAQMDQEQLRRALQKSGLGNDMIEELLRKAAASRSACSRCAGLGQAMASCGSGAGGLSGDQLSDALEQLDQLEALQQQFMLTEASLAELARCMGCIGNGMCDGIGLQGPWREGLARGSGPGTGGPGIGYGPRSTDEDGQTTMLKTKVQNKPGEGPVIASWYFKDSQVKGEARREYSEVLQAARDTASEAINENEIPRKYEEAVKKYFSQLEESGGR